MLRILPFFIGIALTIYALVDAIQADPSHIKYLPKIYWIVLILLFPWIGPIAWLVAGKERPPLRGRTEPRYPKPPRGPDDDPDFLRNL